MSGTPGDEPAELAREALGRELIRLRESDAFAALGLETSAGSAEVRAAFLRLTKLFHPNRFARGDGETRRIANEVFLALKRAYETASAGRDLAKLARGRSAPSSTTPPPATGAAVAVAGPGRPIAAGSGTRPATWPVEGGVSTGRPATGQQTRIRTGSERLPSTAGPTPTRMAAVAPGAAPPAGAAPASSGSASTSVSARAAPRTPTAPHAGVRPTPGSTTSRSIATPTPPTAAEPVAATTAPPSPPAGSASGAASASRSRSTVRFGAVAPPAAAAPTLDAEEAFAAALELCRKRKWTDGRKAFQELAVANPKEKRFRVHMHFAWAKEHLDLGRTEDARAELRRAVNLDPEFRPAERALADLPPPTDDKPAGGLFSKLFRK